VEVPKDWSMTATNIVASKYLHGKIGTPERETGVRQLITRVVETIRDWGLASGYFRTAEDAAVFHDELAHILIQQKAAFNSPVWFNVGCDRLEPESDAQNWHWNPELRQDAARRQDGDLECRPPGHHGVHRVQVQGRGQGVGAGEGRLRRLIARFGSLQLHLFPERQQLSAGDG